MQSRWWIAIQIQSKVFIGKSSLCINSDCWFAVWFKLIITLVTQCMSINYSFLIASFINTNSINCFYMKCSKVELDRDAFAKEHVCCDKWRCELKEDIVTRIEKGMLWELGQQEKMDDRRLTKGIHREKMCVTNGR